MTLVNPLEQSETDRLFRQAYEKALGELTPTPGIPVGVSGDAAPGYGYVKAGGHGRCDARDEMTGERCMSTEHENFYWHWIDWDDGSFKMRWKK